MTKGDSKRAVEMCANPHLDSEPGGDVIHWDLRNKQVGPLEDARTLTTEGR